MLNRIIKTVMGITLVSALAFGQAAAPAVKDQGEYDVMTAISKEQDPTKRLVLLDQWKDKYPDTQFKQNRDIQYIQTYSQAANAAMVPNASGETVAAGQKAANYILENADTLFGSDRKPAQVTDQQWADARKDSLTTAQNTLISIAVNKKDFAGAETEYKKRLALTPDDASISYLLGTVIQQQKKVERYPEVIYDYARAVSLTGPGAWKDEAAKKTTDAYLTKMYTNYHGSVDGLPDVKAKSVLTPLPPADFNIESITEISTRANSNADAFAKQFPEIMLWRGLKDALVSKGDDYFKDMKGADVENLKGKVVAQPNSKELTVAMDYADPKLSETAELTLKFETALKGTVEKGTILTFTASPESYTKEPFMLICAAEKSKVQGLGDAAGAPDKKPTTTKKKATTTKKKTTP